MPAIGIDLGTTNSCVAVWRCGQVEIIANDQGKRTTPSCVAFRDSERSIGELAKNLAAMNPTNTVFDVKRLMGKQWNDPMVQNFYLKQWPVKVQNVLEKPKIEVVSNGRRIQFSPEEISAMVLKKMKEIAEKYLGESVKDAVITVPAYFNDSQRQATIDAGRIAGLNVLGIINEPTAAALAYGLNKNLKTQRRVLIFDQGGGTTDVSILNIKNTVFEVLAKAGDTHLGGEDFDGKLFDYLCNDLKKKCSEDVKSNPRAIIRLKTAVTRLKEDLSTMNVATVFIDSLLPGYDYHVDVSRELFENICDDLFDQTLEPVVKVLEINKIDKMSIDDIVLVGGSTRIPKVQSILQNFFCGKKLNFTINPDEAVAYGAAIQAELLSVDKKISPTLQKVLLFDITPFALGIEVRSKGLITIIEKNTKIPCRFTKEFLNSSENQTEIQINVFEGNDPIARNNNCIGGFLLSGVTPGALHTVKIDVTFDLDANGILHVTARDRTSGSSNEIKIIHNKGSLSREEIQQILLDADRLGKQDIKERQKLSAKSSLDKYISSLMQAVEDSSSTLNRSGKNQILSVCKETEHWINVNSHADADDYCKELQEIEEKCTSIMTQNKKRKTSLISTKSQGSKKNKK